MPFVHWFYKTGFLNAINKRENIIVLHYTKEEFLTRYTVSKKETEMFSEQLLHVSAF